MPVPASLWLSHVASIRYGGLSTKETSRCKNFFALGLMFWLYNRDTERETTGDSVLVRIVTNGPDRNGEQDDCGHCGQRRQHREQAQPYDGEPSHNRTDNATTFAIVSAG